MTVPNDIPTVGLVNGGHHLGERGSAGRDKRLQVRGKSCVISLEEGPGKFLKALQTLRNRLCKVIGFNTGIGSDKGSEGDALTGKNALCTVAASGEAQRGSSPSCLVMEMEWVGNWKARDWRAISLCVSLPMLHGALAWIIICPLGDLGMDDRAEISSLCTFRQPFVCQICFQEFGHVTRIHSNVKGSPDGGIRELDLNNLPKGN